MTVTTTSHDSASHGDASHGSAAPDATPKERLMALHRAGELTERYPEVRALVTELSGADFTQAGHLLARLDTERVTQRHPQTAVFRVAVTGHGTLVPLVPALTAELARHGMLLDATLSDFDSWVFDLGDAQSAVYEAKPDAVLCVLDPTVVLDELTAPWRVADAERVLAEKLALLRRLAATFDGAGHGTLVLNTLPLPARITGQLLDYRSRAALGAAWRRFNAELLCLGDRFGSVVTLDLDPLLAEGVPAGDDRLSVYTKAHLSPALLSAYAREVGHLGRALTGRAKKVLALDLDETVWGGILGEDGPLGIEVADSYRGEAFRAFQNVVKQIGSQGVLVAAVSKNDAEPVLSVLRDHPRMTLREDDFVRVAANWDPKHDNLARLADDLNLNVDSFVFADDSSFECGLVRRELPDVAVVRLDREPALHVRRLLRDGWFSVRELTDEDEKRSVRYRDELTRKDFLDTFSSLDDYLRELQVRVRIAPASGADLDRVSQITLRTNQFNLTTRRLQPDEVRARAAAANTDVLAVHVSDRFGDNGLVGAVLTRRDGDRVHIDNFLLSCRVFSRGVETACLSAVLRHARESGAASVVASYRPTAKNTKVKDFYPRGGFTYVAEEDGASTFRHGLVDILPVPDHIHLTEELGNPS
ncbi:HAD-IIIC family phosphatase [Streptomyces sp. NPDC017405]|uniref:HAD-IIIC family phosphatase n=1 Tax=unclassified Streptomyces TaxID=2593676 RepID=UPI0037A9C6FF